MGSGGRFGGGLGSIGTGTGSDVRSVIDAAAARHGVNPRYMYWDHRR